MAGSARCTRWWAFYRRYSQTATHTAATAAMAIFGVLVVVDSRFVILALIAYLGPLVVSYWRREFPAEGQNEARSTARSKRDSVDTGSHDRRDPDSSRSDSDTDGLESDTDTDRPGTDTDTDRPGTDTDTDRPGTDTDSDT